MVNLKKLKQKIKMRKNTEKDLEKLKVELLDTESLKPNPKNPRINDQTVDDIVKSIKEFGWTVPIIADQNLVLATGHARLKAAKQLGLKKIPVVIKKMTESERDAYVLADNKIAEKSIWDQDALAKILESINFSNPELLGATGFDIQEIEELIDNTSIESLMEDQGPLTKEDKSVLAGEKSHVRMVQIFLDDKTFPLFIGMVEKIQVKLGTSNLTDTIYAAIEAIHDQTINS